MKTLQNPEKIKHIGEFYTKLKETHYEYLDFWLHNTLFHWDFFLSLFLSIVPWVLWVTFKKNESTYRLLFAGFFVLIISSWLDFCGTMYGLWYYTGKMIPLMPSYSPWDFSILPVSIMFFIQYKPKLSPVLKALIFAFVSSFIGEPFFQWVGLYVITKWNVFYSFPIYFVIYLFAHKLSRVYKFAQL
jgi:hypothetical protein